MTSVGSGHLDSDINILRQMCKSVDASAPVEQLPTARAIRLAMTRAADASVGLAISVTEVKEAAVDSDALVGALSDNDLLLTMARDGAAIGVVSLDQELRSAVIEQQTKGAVEESAALERPITGTDMLIVSPLIGHFLGQAAQALAGSDLSDWIAGLASGSRFADARAVGLALADTQYLMLDISVQITQSRVGRLKLALPQPAAGIAAGAATSPPHQVNWADRFSQSVLQAPAALEAQIARLDLTIAQMRQMRPGQVLPLYGATVGTVKLIAPDKTVICSARLGQSAGKRAVRVQFGAVQALADTPPLKPVEVQALA